MKSNIIRSQEAKHWRGVIAKYNKLSDQRPLTADEYQQLYFAQSELEKVYQSTIVRTMGKVIDEQPEAALEMLKSLVDEN